MRVVLAAVLLATLLAAGPQTGHPLRSHRERRARLARDLGADYALLFGQPLTDVLQPRQEGHFLYLTGLDEPGAVLLLAGKRAAPLALGPDRPAVREALFLPDRGRTYARFLGIRYLPGEEAARALGVEAAPPLPRGSRGLAELLDRLLPRKARLNVPAYKGLDDGLVRARRRALLALLARSRPDLHVLDLHPRLAAMRAVKDDGELGLMEEAMAVTLDAFREALPAIRPGSSEAAVDAALLAAIRRRRARPAYPFVVAAGANSCTPHYFRNDGPLAAGDLLVIDAGAEVGHYAADVTRTFPVSGRFTKRQRQVYDAVLRAQRAALRAVRPGVTLPAVHAAARAVLEREGLDAFMLHATSHPIGLDVHDPVAGRLAPGMTITVEPGVYIATERIGVRIEDVVLVTEKGARVLSAAFPREADAIERWMAR